MSKKFRLIVCGVAFIALFAVPVLAQNIAGEYQVRVKGENVLLDRSPASQSISDTTTLKVSQSGDRVTMEFGSFGSASAATIFKGKVGNQRFAAVWWYQGSDHETKVLWGSVSGDTLKGRMIYPRVAYRGGLVPGWVEIAFTARKTTAQREETGPRQDTAQREDCLGFAPNRLEVRRDNNGWLLTDGRSRMKVFDNRNEAIRTLNTIKHYGMNKHCFIGRPDPSMEYWLVGNNAPSGPMPQEDCIAFNPANLRIRKEGNQWLMTDGRSRMRMFPNRQEAEQALDIIRQYGFNRTCYIGRPDPSMTYFRK